MTTEQQELFVRADNFVTTMIPLADQTRPYAMWCGWALNEAWRVGYAAGRAAQAEQTSGKAADVPRTQPDDAESPGPLDPIADLCARLRDEYEGCPSPVTTARVATLREAADALERLARERDDIRLHAEIEFLHKRRGELVIERDRYKAALGQYPEGRDVMLSGALAEVETLRTEVVALREQLRLANVDAAIESAERNRLLDLLSDAGLELARAKVFVGSREKMHPTGLMLYQTLLDKISDVIEVKGEGKPNMSHG